MVFVITNAGALIISELGPSLLGLFGYNRIDAFKAAPPDSFTGMGKKPPFGGDYPTTIYDIDNPSNTFWLPGRENETLSYILYGIADAGMKEDTLNIAGNLLYVILLHDHASCGLPLFLFKCPLP